MTAVTERRVAVVMRPRREGANIRTWVGFKHFMYLAEEAVLEWFRHRDLGPTTLFHDHGLALSIVDSSVHLPAVLDMDDAVEAEVTGGPSRFTVRLNAVGPRPRAVLRGTVTVALVPVVDAAPVPAELASAVGRLASAVGRLADLPAARLDLPVGPSADPARLLATRNAGAFVWSWRVPYFYCQFSHHIQHSGYVRALEEVVDRFLADRGLSIRTMLVERGWIPVVSRARLTQLVEAAMDETVHTVFTVTDVLKGVGFDARMDCYVERAGTLTHTATGRILHAYVIAHGPDAGRLAELDAATVAALTGERGR